MNQSKRLLRILIGSLVITLVAGCAQATTPGSRNEEPKTASASEPSQQSLTFQDDTGRSVRLKAEPQQIVVLSPQLLDLLYAVGGTAIARTSASGGNVPEQAKPIEDIGGMTTVNTEKLLSLKPDLVIGSPNFHCDLTPILDASSIPFALFNLSTYKDLKEKALLLGKLSGSESKANEELSKLDQRIGQYTGKVPADNTPTFVMLNVTPSSISIQRTNTVGLEVANMLKMKNVAESLDSPQNSQSTAPYSLEKLAELNPDYVFILIHGAKEAGEKKIQADLSSQPAWSSLRAVKERRMAVLSSDLFLSNPGFRLDESVASLAKLVYPERFSNGK
ncbi:Fe(3+)-citrate-binding protein YfmC [Paenibacillus solanacearum]|uniref:Fe(3+)-citrate-binding protein YfmC n=1 Tax=Paenibacillus solanacearum TaxID=2048548 RepID=A0A916K990_9BACL|nr:ABC transporter substrate-binding protein [Paenibacillus solanacearum]CAG7648320.1 Fe(3+)-citrate-binding protein YfmC [Paenibacillus solanacearum]